MKNLLDEKPASFLTLRPRSGQAPSLFADPEHSRRLKTLLARVRHFDGLQPEVQERLAASAIPRHFTAGQVIYLEGEPAESIFIIESGWVKATRMSREGREQALLFLRAGEVFGDVGMFTHTAYPGTVTALENVHLWVIPAGTVLQMAGQYPDFAMAVIRHLGDRLLYYVTMIEDLSLRSVEARLARTLLRNAIRIDGRLTVPRATWTTFNEMAVRLGTVRDVLSRALHTLENEGLLKVERREIILLDSQGLASRGDL
jgi:CRP/FNR family transcriptional regulator